MALFDFLKTKKEETRSEFIGRWIQAMKAFALLGQEFSDSDIKIAFETDNFEHQEIINEVEKIEENISTGDLKHIFGAAKVHKEMGETITKGLKNCVLLNDLDLKNRCFEIRKQAKNVLQNEANKQDGRNLDLNKADYVLESIGDFANINLGGLLPREKGSEEMGDPEKAWFIIRLLHSPNSLRMLFMLTHDSNKTEIMELADKLLAAGKITDTQLSEISENFDGLFEMGQEYQNKKI